MRSLLVIFAGVIASLIGGFAAQGSDAPLTPSVEVSRVVPENQAQITLSFAPIVKQAAPAVVNIYTKKIVERRVSPFVGDPFFERFFDDMFPRGQTRRRIEDSLGSGVILESSGIVVSNYHVVGGADQITVVLQDRREFSARVILADEESDLAVLHLQSASDLPVLALRDSDTLEVGDLVLAIGNPFGVGQTVTSGIISGLARSRGAAGRGTGFFIQTDAAINPGNSGGALVDMQGRLVGVNTAILSRSGGSNGIGFAVPSNLVATVMRSAQEGAEELVRPWFGLEGQEVTGELAAAFDLAVPQGIAVEALHPESPLARAGVEQNDVLSTFDGYSVNTLQELEFRAATRPLGSRVRIVYIRQGVEQTAELELAAAPDLPARAQTDLGPGDGLPGLRVLNVNPSVIQDLGLPVTSSGVLVISAKGAARRVGLKRGDFIRDVDGQSIGTVSDLVTALAGTAGETALRVERKGRVGYIRYRR